jgi:acetylcholinesterase
VQGQSAGAESVDIHNFAYRDEPIVQGYFMSSGTTFLSLASSDETYSNFSFVASRLGCGGLNASAELDCMRIVPFHDIQNLIGQYAQNNIPLSFSQAPVITDDKIFFKNYTERYSMGAYTKLPAIISNTENEGAVIPPFPPINPAIVEAGTRMFLCGAANASTLRTNTGSVTYRFEFAGNVSPAPYLGAFHDSDLPHIFGTYSELRGPPIDFEVQVSQAMQDRVLAFMKDPTEGPRDFGWRPYSEGRMLQFGLDGIAMQDKAVQDLEGPCQA